MARALLVVLVFLLSEAKAQTGLEEFNYSVGDVFLYSENTSGGSTNHTGVITKYTIVSKLICQSCYQYGIEGIRQEWYENLESSGEVSNYFSDVIYICPDNVAYWNNLNAIHLGSSIINGVPHGAPMWSDERILGNNVRVSHPPTDILLDTYEFYESDTAGIVISNIIIKDPDGADDLRILSFVPSCDGPNDNQLFKFYGATIASNSTFYFDAQDTYQIRIKAEDSKRGIIIKNLTLILRKGLRPMLPGITLSSSSVRVSLPIETLIGEIGTGTTLPYDFFIRFEKASGYHENYHGHHDYITSKYNSHFLIRDGKLLSNAVFDSVRTGTDAVKIFAVTNIGAPDGRLLIFSQDLVISILDGPYCSASITQDGNNVTASSGVSYQWVENGLINPSLTSKSITPAFGTGWFHIYAAVVTNSEGCSASSDPYCGFYKPTLYNKGTFFATDYISGTTLWFRDGALIQSGNYLSDFELLPGSYTVQDVVANCYSLVSDPVIIPYVPEPTVSIIIRGNTLHLIVENGAAVRIDWSWNLTMLSEYRNLWDITPEKSGVYDALVEFDDGRIKVSNPITIVVMEVDQSCPFVLSPNPSTSKATISKGNQGIVKGVLYNNTGQVMQEFFWDSYDDFIINMSGCSPGIYLLHISDNEMKHWMMRLVRE